MARPKLYQTRQERLEANRAKSQRYYYRNQDDIAARRQQACNQNKSQRLKRSPSNRPSSSARKEGARLDDRVSPQLVDALAIEELFLDLTKGSTEDYIQKLHHEFQNNRQHGPIEDAILAVSNLLVPLITCSDHILQEGGLGGEWKRVETIIGCVRGAERALQSLLCDLL